MRTAGRSWRTGRPTRSVPRRVAFVDGTLRTEARLTRTGPDGTNDGVNGTDVEAARLQLQRLMRDAEADIAEALSNAGWLTVRRRSLHGIRHRRGRAIIGYVKTHHRRMLAREHWVRVPEMTARERSGPPSSRSWSRRAP